MKTMNRLGVGRMLGSVRRRASPSATPIPEGGPEAAPLDTPEANAERSVKLFCESGGPEHQQGEEVLYLPAIVEAAESSPKAAKECAIQIRKFLSRNSDRPYLQYNAVMLMRILTDNPGPSFTKNIDSKFVETVKSLLRFGRDLNVKQILTETLQNFENNKKSDVNLTMLLQMWVKEKEKMARTVGAETFAAQQAPRRGDPSYFSRHHQIKGLPEPAELSSRIEEAKTTAKLLTQLIQSTPSEEFLANDLVREFANRCISASRSIQGYMVADNPGPDNDTMLTLIETNEQLALAQSKYQRAFLNARKALGLGAPAGTSPGGTEQALQGENGAPPPGPPPSHAQPVAQAAVAELPPNNVQSENPFKDPVQAETVPTTTHNPPFPDEAKSKSSEEQPERLGVEPYHPGFNSTQSYMGRQESSIGKVTMHAAIPDAEEEDEEELEARSRKPPVFRY